MAVPCRSLLHLIASISRRSSLTCRVCVTFAQAELGDDQNVDLDEMFADLSAWFPSTHGEQAPVATSGWGGGAAGGEEIYLGNGDADVWNGGGGVRGL